ncbi:MAG: CgeB family protein [Desulfoprunum sp.]
MKILIAGDWHSEIHEESVYQAFQQLGHEPIRFSWHQFFKHQKKLGRLAVPLLKAQNKYMVGPVVNRLNRDLVNIAASEQPDMVLIYRGSHIFPSTLRELSRSLPNAILVGYNNDDPFSPNYPGWKWRHFLASIPEYDLMLAYRLHNIEEFKKFGAKRVELLRSWFIPEANHPINLERVDREKYECDVVFVGHFENDGRIDCLEEIVRRGWKLKLFGHSYGWHKHILRSDILKSFYPLSTVWDVDYNKALCGAKVGLCFFSKLNRDTYTRRCFEIPAAGTLLMSEFSSDLAGLFEEEKEAVYFRTTEELLEKLEKYLGNESLRNQVALAGYEKVYESGHDVKSRMEQLLQIVSEMITTRLYNN